LPAVPVLSLHNALHFGATAFLSLAPARAADARLRAAAATPV